MSSNLDSKKRSVSTNCAVYKSVSNFSLTLEQRKKNVENSKSEREKKARYCCVWPIGGAIVLHVAWLKCELKERKDKSIVRTILSLPIHAVLSLS